MLWLHCSRCPPLVARPDSSGEEAEHRIHSRSVHHEHYCLLTSTDHFCLWLKDEGRQGNSRIVSSLCGNKNPFSGQPCHLLVGLFHISSFRVHRNTKHHLDIGGSGGLPTGHCVRHAVGVRAKQGKWAVVKAGLALDVMLFGRLVLDVELMGSCPLALDVERLGSCSVSQRRHGKQLQKARTTHSVCVGIRFRARLSGEEFAVEVPQVLEIPCFPKCRGSRVLRTLHFFEEVVDHWSSYYVSGQSFSRVTLWNDHTSSRPVDRWRVL